MGKTSEIFKTDRRIRLGIWGLGRGQSFINAAKHLNIDVVAGCDYNQHMRERFLQNCPGAYASDDEDDFLAQDFDAVLIATWFCSHAEHTIKALRAGKHVMCEVTSFFTPAEAVRVVEAVESSGLVYNLLENYPFQIGNMYIRSLWQQGFFGDFMYAEYDYVHECRSLSYTYIDGVPVKPGYHAHQWRSWLDFHYYNTHSLGPVMQITGLRPTRICALPSSVALPGYLGDGKMGGIAPSLISMSNGGIMRNLMGGTSSDSHTRKLWGTKAAVDLTGDVRIRVGGSGHGRWLTVAPKWPEMAELASQAGHGGGDFWELFYFARQVLTGEPAPWDIYAACDVTMAGIMAVKSTQANGEPMDIPDFRDRKVREAFRNDHFAQEHFDPEAIFPAGHDPAITGNFTTVMSLFSSFRGYIGTILVRNVFDGMALYPDLASDQDRFAVIADVRKLIHELPAIAANYREALAIADAYPDSLAAKAIYDHVHSAEMAKVLDTDKTIAELRDWLATM